MTEEFIHSWNEIIEFKIQKNDLKKPTCQFLFDALKAYLRRLNINVDKIRDQIENNDERLQNIHFCQYVDKLYKISDSSNSFCYMDFVAPSEYFAALFDLRS